MSSGGFQGLVGLLAGEAGAGKALITLDATDDHLNATGTVHGGVIATLVDVAMGKALDTLIDHDEHPVTIEMKINYLEPGRTGRLVAAAEVRKRGRRFTVVQAEVSQESDGEAVAEAMGTYTTGG